MHPIKVKEYLFHVKANQIWQKTLIAIWYHPIYNIYRHSEWTKM